MPVVRVISWNIYHFSTSRSGAALAGPATAHRCNIILDLVHPAGAARTCDIFVIIETQTAKPAGYANVGLLATAGATGGMMATQQLRTQLQARHLAAGGGGTWDAVPPVFLTAKKFAEAISIFFHTAAVTFTGPVTDAAIVAPSPWRTANTQDPLGGPGTLKGQTRFFVPGMPPAEIVFNANNQRRPYKADFQTVAGAVNFSLVAHHSPSPSATQNNRKAREGTENLGSIREITVNRANPVIIVGDFNCCTMSPCPNNGCYLLDLTAQEPLTGPGTVGYRYGEKAIEAIRQAVLATTAAENAAAASVIAAANAGNAGNAHAAALNAQAAAVAAGNAVNAAAAAHSGVVGALAPLVGNAQTAGANALAAAVTALGLAATHIAEAATCANLALAARNQALLINDYYNANTTTYLQNLSGAVRSAANAIDNPGGAGAHAVNAGNSANAAVGAIGGVPVPNAAVAVAAAAVPIAAAQGGGATNGGPGVALAKGARDAALAVAGRLYLTHIYSDLSSLKGSGARPTGIAGYRNHAFDHILTIGAQSVANAGVIDLVPTVMNAYHVAYANGMNLATFRAGFKYLAIWGKKGVSDHLPVRADITV